MFFSIVKQSFSKLSKKSLINYSYSAFSTSPPPPNPKEQELSQFEKFANVFFASLQSAKTLKSEPDYTYSNKIIYDNPMNSKFITSSKRMKILSSFFWVGISSLTFIYIHPFVTIIPAWFASGSFLSFLMARNYSKKLVTQIEISEDKKDLIVRLLLGKSNELHAKIEDLDMTDIIEVNPEKNKKKIDENTFVITFDLKDKKGKQFYQLRMFIEPGITKIENYELFKYIISGEINMVEKFHWDPEKEKKTNEDEKEIEKKIEAEFERIKKEAEENEKKIIN